MCDEKQPNSQLPEPLQSILNGHIEAQKIAVLSEDPKSARLREFVRLTNQKRELEADLRDVKARLGELEPQILDHFQQDGIQRVTVDGYTLYLSRSLYAGPKDGDKDRMIQSLQGLDESWSFLVSKTVNRNQLSARVRECEQNAEGQPVLPDALKDAVEVFEQFTIGARKAG